MNSYAMYRIAETLRVVLFMTVAILVFNFYPVTAVMIVMIALLNDGAILSIAYDNVRYSNKPKHGTCDACWASRLCSESLGSFLAFLLFWLGERVFHLDRAHVSDADISEAFGGRSSDDLPDRTRDPFWTIKPAKTLWIACSARRRLRLLSRSMACS